MHQVFIDFLTGLSFQLLGTLRIIMSLTKEFSQLQKTKSLKMAKLMKFLF